MLKKIFKTIWKIILFLLILLFFFSVVIPAYRDYKLNKKEVVVDTSGERATSRNKAIDDIASGKSNNDDGNSWKLERKDDYDPFTFDDRILLYEGNLDSDSMNKLMEVLIEDIDSKTYSKVDVELNGIGISYDDKDTYSSSLINFKNSISQGNKYLVEFEYSVLRAVVNKVVIKNI